jgi:hypothetical protein
MKWTKERKCEIDKKQLFFNTEREQQDAISKEN